MQTQQKLAAEGTSWFSMYVKENDRRKLRREPGHQYSSKTQIKGSDRGRIGEQMDWVKNDEKIIRVVSERSIKQGVKRQRRKFCVDPERTAGDGRIMTEGGASLTPRDLTPTPPPPPPHPAAGKRLQQWRPYNMMGYPAACLHAHPSSSAAAICSRHFTVTSAPEYTH